MIAQTTLHKITEVAITQKALDHGLTELDIFKLIFGLETEYRAYEGRVIEPHFTYEYRGDNQNHLTIVGIFEPGEWRAQVCICVWSELKKGKKTGFGRELLYPRDAKIGTTIDVIRLSEEPGLFLSRSAVS